MGAYLRLLGAVWTLTRNDALLPFEADPYYPAGVRVLARALRLVASRRSGRPGERMARSLETLGPVAIKGGQLLSTRGDVFGPVFAEDLGRLKDRLAPFPLAQARAEVERELGRPIEAVFETFGEPVAAASLAQAHDAILRDGRRVAVKVLRPGIERRVQEDSEALALAGRLVARWWPLARRLEPVKLYCIEEPLSPDNLTGYERLVREISSTRIASGEHEYTHHGFAELIRHQAVDVLQPDVTWCGGVTAVRKVAAMAAEHGLEFTPHRGGSLFGLPLCLSSTQCQWAESFGTNEPSSELMAAMMSPYRDGFYFPSEQPGFGTTLTEEMIKRHLVA